MTGMRDQAAAVAVLKALRDAIDEQYTAARAGLTTSLVQAWQDTGVKSIRASLPDGTVVGTITLAEPSDTLTVVDERVFVRWVKVTYPSEVSTVTQVRPGWRKSFLAGLPVADPPVDPSTGEVIPGVALIPAGEPRTFSLRFARDGRDAVAHAWREGRLSSLAGPLAITEEVSHD